MGWGWRQEYETIGGETLTRKEWCERYGMNMTTAYQRVMIRGWDFERAVKTPRVKRDWEKILETIDGETLTRREWCERRGLNRKTVYERMARGETFYEAVTDRSLKQGVKRKSTRRKPERKTMGAMDTWRQWNCTIGGITLTRGEWCAVAGADEETVYELMKKKLRFAEALTGLTEEKAMIKFLTINGRSLEEIMEEKGLSARSVIIRLGKGYPPEIAAMTDYEFAQWRKKKIAMARKKAKEEGKEYMSYNDFRAGDSPQFVELCLNCTKKECTGNVFACVKDRLICEKLGLRKSEG